MEGVYLVPDTWRVVADKPILIGSRCAACETVFFPSRQICGRCGSDGRVTEVELSRRGRLYSYTVIYKGPRGFRTPYAVGYVDLPEGVRVFAPLAEIEGLAIDDAVELTWGEVGEDARGRPMLAFQFRRSR